MRNAVLVGCLFCCLVLGCDPEAPEVRDFGPAGNRIHLLPFSCTYFGLPISELEGCSIACPGSVFGAYDLATFTARLECAHPHYKLLQCGIDR